MNDSYHLPNQVVIIGAGTSVFEGIKKGLWDKLKDKFTVGCNFCCPVFVPSMSIEPTVVTFVDDQAFYTRYYNKMNSIPFMIGRFSSALVEINKKTNKSLLLPNTVLVDNIHNLNVTGVFTLSLIVKLGIREIFILGMDCGGRPVTDEQVNHFMDKVPLALEDITEIPINKFWKKNIIEKNGRKYLFKSHWYQDEFKHRGVGRVEFYYDKQKHNKPKIEGWYDPFKNLKDIKIYNVSLISRIPETYFEKISYDKFFELLDNRMYNQNELRQQLRKVLKNEK